MHKVIVERPRRGWRSRPHKRKTFAGEDALPTKMGVRRHVAVMGIKSKWFNDHVKPLKRFLFKQVGRPWDDVYSEIASVISKDNVVQKHVYQHVDGYVAHDISIGRYGEWVRPTGRYFLGDRLWYQPLYVDPIDGLLKESEPLWKAQGIDLTRWHPLMRVANPDVVELEELRELRRIEGIWYEFLFDKRPGAPREEKGFDLLTRTTMPLRERRAIAKRQLSRDELKAYGITNDVKV
jgi:hypothetical protein